jgi:hypothetical protein
MALVAGKCPERFSIRKLRSWNQNAWSTGWKETLCRESLLTMHHRTGINTDVICRILGIIVFAEAYALVRYAVFKGVSLNNWPLYLNNKALSLAGLTLIAASLALRRTSSENGSASNGRPPGVLLARVGFALIGLHVLMSLPLLGPGYFPQFFAGDKMNLTGELSLFFGVWSFGCCVGVAGLTLSGTVSKPSSARRSLIQRLALAALATAAGHVLVMGAAGWITPAKWPGGMPPITLLAFLAAVIPLLLWSRRR